MRIWDARGMNIHAYLQTYMHAYRVCQLFSAGKPTGTVSTKGENINISWSPDGHTIAVGNKVYLFIIIIIIIVVVVLRRIY